MKPKKSSERVIMLGDHSVGKTTLVTRLCDDKFDPDAVPTIATACFKLEPKGPNTDPIQIWDTAGSERYRSLNTVYYHNAMGGLLLFDLTSRTSFDNLTSWIEEFKMYAEDTVKIILIGNKCDMQGQKIHREEAENWAESQGMKYFQCSALTGEGIKELLDYIHELFGGAVSQDAPESVAIEAKRQPEPQSGCC